MVGGLPSCLVGGLLDGWMGWMGDWRAQRLAYGLTVWLTGELAAWLVELMAEPVQRE